MRRLAVSAAEEPDEMEFGEMGFVGNVVQINGLRKMRIHKKLGLHDAAVEIDLGIAFVRGIHPTKVRLICFGWAN